MRNPFGSEAPKPGTGRCGVLAQFNWGGKYDAHCIRPHGHGGKHFDGIVHSEYATEAEALEANLGALFGAIVAAPSQPDDVACGQADEEAGR